MERVRYRRRGTAIVETEHGILLTGGHGAGHKKPFILPGGGAERGESRFMAALRELSEETRLRPYYAEIIFTHKGKVRPTHSGRGKFQDHHTVCLIKATGYPKPGGGDAKRLSYFHPGSRVWVSRTTMEIIERYYKWKQNKVKQSMTDLDEENVEDADPADRDKYYDSDEEVQEK